MLRGWRICRTLRTYETSGDKKSLSTLCALQAAESIPRLKDLLSMMRECHARHEQNLPPENMRVKLYSNGVCIGEQNQLSEACIQYDQTPEAHKVMVEALGDETGKPEAAITT